MTHNELYQQKKEEIRQEAIETQLEVSKLNLSHGEIADICSYFEKQGKRYGLLREFRENGII